MHCHRNNGIPVTGIPPEYPPESAPESESAVTGITQPDNPEEFKRFTELAREVGADKQGAEFDRVLNTVARPQTKVEERPRRPKRKPRS
jgi:hypothetical protein